jgi:GTPase SAR1 family protein
MVMMNNKNKIILIGPPESGKTTISEVFFRNENPLKLINNPLDPTRGINSNLYTLFNSQLGIHDLAGQENAHWFSSGQNVFSHTDLVVCIFDITNSVEIFFQFLMKVVNGLLKMKGLSETQMFILLHKIDLVNSAYLSKKKKIIKEFFKSLRQKEREIRIFGTSIKKEHFYHTY